MIEQAILFATNAHSGQVRKYTGEPYVFHCFEVANMVKQLGGTDEMVTAAILHDTVEDTSVTIELIRETFGVVVASYVEGLTDVSTPKDGNRKARKALDREHLSVQPKEVQTIKVCDLISNTKSIKEHDPSFWRTYREEKSMLLAVLTKAPKHLLDEAVGML